MVSTLSTLVIILRTCVSSSMMQLQFCYVILEAFRHIPKNLYSISFHIFEYLNLNYGSAPDIPLSGRFDIFILAI